MSSNRLQRILEPGSYLEEKENSFILHETGLISSSYFEDMNLSKITEDVEVIDFKYELIRVNCYNPELKQIEHDANVMGISIYVPPKYYIGVQNELGWSDDKYPTVLKYGNSLVFCSFRDLHHLLYKVLDAKSSNKGLSAVFRYGHTKIKKQFVDLVDESAINVEINLYNKCRDYDLMKTVSPWIFVNEFIEKSRIKNVNTENIFWGIVKADEKSYLPMLVWGKYFATELVECHPTELCNEKLPGNVKRIVIPEEDEDGIGVAYKRIGDMYEVRVWIKFEEYIRKFYKKFDDTTKLKENEIEESVKRHISKFKREEIPLYYQLEKIVPEVLFKYDMPRIIDQCRNILTDKIVYELERHHYDVK